MVVIAVSAENTLDGEVEFTKYDGARKSLGWSFEACYDAVGLKYYVPNEDLLPLALL